MFRLSPNFYDFNVWTTKKRVEKLRYLHRNPVKRGLVGSPEPWRWSSYRFYFLGEAGMVRVNAGWTKISFRDASREALRAQNTHCGRSGSRPCKKRKDGAPTDLVASAVQRLAARPFVA